MRSLKLRGIWLAIGWLYVAFVIFCSLYPSPPRLPGFESADKLAHLGGYAVMMLWFGFIYLPGRRLLILGSFFVLLGIAVDIVQGATGYRSTESLDMISNAAGVSVGVLLAGTRLGSTLVFVEGFLFRGGEKPK